MVSQSQFEDAPPWRLRHFVGGHPALDLVNTISHRLDPSLAVDRMNAPAKIATWMVEVGVLTAGEAAARVRPARLDTPGLVAALALLVLDGVFRLPRARVHACPRCGWLFRDRSKGRRRRWCLMKVCGNREKVARHYRVRRDTAGSST